MDQQHVETYLLDLIKPRNPLLTEMEEYAKENGVPIMDLLGMEYMLQLLRLIQPKRVLEIGTAIGYSGLRMIEEIEGLEVVSIERDEDRYEKAIQYIERAQCDSIHLIYGDALETFSEVEAFGTFDVIFIDAAKSQYRRFFELYEPLLTETGVIISDNVLFKGLIAAEKIESRNVRQMMRKLRNYNEWLVNNPNYDTTIFPIGDGVAVSKKKR
ncbi:MAG: O-methyltransferase [Bacillaceae bacterium]